MLYESFTLFQDMVRALEQLVALRTELQESNSTCEQQVRDYRSVLRGVHFDSSQLTCLHGILLIFAGAENPLVIGRTR